MTRGALRAGFTRSLVSAEKEKACQRLFTKTTHGGLNKNEPGVGKRDGCGSPNDMVCSAARSAARRAGEFGDARCASAQRCELTRGETGRTLARLVRRVRVC